MISALIQYVIIIGVSQWYFTEKNSNGNGRVYLLKGLYWSFRYNLGSLALGSFILGFIWIIRTPFEFMLRKFQKTDANGVVRTFSIMTCCCCTICHKFVKYLDRNAYIQLALTGHNFCPSAMTAYTIALKSRGYFMQTNGLSALILVLCKLTISMTSMLTAQVMLATMDNIEMPLIPLFLVFVASYLVAGQFMSVYLTTSLTLMQCIFVHMDICRQDHTNIWSNVETSPQIEQVLILINRAIGRKRNRNAVGGEGLIES